MRTVPLGEIVQIEFGYPFKSTGFNAQRQGLPVVRIRDVNRGSSDTYFSGDFDARYLVNDGDYLIGMDGEFNLGRWHGGDALLNQRVARLGAFSADTDGAYVARYLPLALKEIEDRTPYVTVKHLSARTLRAIEVPLPPLDEQRRIAAVLDHADSLRTTRQKVLARFDDLQSATFIDMFGPPSTWPRRWNMGTIGDMADDVQYGTSAKAGEDGSLPIIRMGNVTDTGRLDLSDLKWIDIPQCDLPKFTVRRGDLLFNRTNSRERVGKTCVVDTDADFVFAGYLIRVRLKPEHRPEFVNAYMTSRFGRALRYGMAKAAVNQANINASEMRSISIALPPKDVQQRFAKVVEQIDSERHKHQRVLLAADELFPSLQSRAFSGRL